MKSAKRTLVLKMFLKPALLAAAVLVAGCGSVEYRDSNAAVDARAECLGMGSEQTGEPIPAWCKREQGTTWSSGSDDKIEVDFSGKDDDGR
jgi:hypothetical protein